MTGYCVYNTLGGSSSAVERQLPKLNVVGSIPITRSYYLCGRLSAFMETYEVTDLAAFRLLHLVVGLSRPCIAHNCG